MKKWIAVLVMVLGAEYPVNGQEAVSRGEYVPPARMPTISGSDAAVPAPKAADAGPEPTTLSAPMLPADAPTESKEAGKLTLETPPAATKSVPAPAAPTGCAPVAGSLCGSCQTKYQRSCYDKLMAWFCYHREKNPDCCYVGGRPLAPLYAYFLEYPCVEGNITVPAVPTSCACKRPCPLQNCFFGQVLGNGNLSCH
jgi:hypothetical protein